MIHSEMALARFRSGSNCSQAILISYSRACDLDEEALHRLGTGFGAGFGKKQYTCGAVTAAIAVLGLVDGNRCPSEFEKREKVLRDVFALIDGVEAEFGSVNCREILGVSIQTPEESERANLLGIIEDRCGAMIGWITSHLDESLGGAQGPSSREAEFGPPPETQREVAE